MISVAFLHTHTLIATVRNHYVLYWLGLGSTVYAACVVVECVQYWLAVKHCELQCCLCVCLSVALTKDDSIPEHDPEVSRLRLSSLHVINVKKPVVL